MPHTAVRYDRGARCAGGKRRRSTMVAGAGRPPRHRFVARRLPPSGGPTKGSASWAFWPMAGSGCASICGSTTSSAGTRPFCGNGRIRHEGGGVVLPGLAVRDGQGHLVTNPSTSPDINFVAPDGSQGGGQHELDDGPELIRSLFTNLIEACRLLGEDEAFRRRA